MWAAIGRQIDTGWGVIVTQTCDLIRPPDGEPWVQVAPLIDLKSENAWQRARSGNALDVFSLPQPDEEIGVTHAAVHAQLSFPIEKSAFLHDEVKTVRTPLDASDRIFLSIWLARRCGRHAFPDPTEDLVLRPLRAEISRRWDKPNTQTGAFVRSLVGVWATAYESAVVEICFVMSSSKLLANQGALPGTEAIAEQVKIVAGACAKAITRAASELRIEAYATTLDSIPAETLLMRMRQVDLDLLPAAAHLAAQEIAVGLSESQPPSQPPPCDRGSGDPRLRRHRCARGDPGQNGAWRYDHAEHLVRTAAHPRPAPAFTGGPESWETAHLRLEDLLVATTERVDLVGQALHSPFGLDQGLAECLTAAAFANEVDKVGQPALLGRELFQLERVGQIGVPSGTPTSMRWDGRTRLTAPSTSQRLRGGRLRAARYR